MKPKDLSPHGKRIERALQEAVAEAIEKLARARRFNQGFETVEYTACALVDMALHAQTQPDGVDITAFEREELARIGMPREIVMRRGGGLGAFATRACMGASSSTEPPGKSDATCPSSPTLRSTISCAAP